MTDIEIDVALAKAIGWPDKSMKILKQLWLYTGYKWTLFNHKDWNVVGPIAAKYNLFPYSAAGWWIVAGTGCPSSTTAQGAIALAAIQELK